jgi:hypothetical protein
MRSLTAIAALAFATALLLTMTVTGAAAAGCPNEAIREAQVSEALSNGTTGLPACMALELVSPAKKFNQYAKRPNLAASGERAAFASVAALADTTKQGSIFDPYIATRTASGWVTEATATPPQYTVGYQAAAIPCVYSADLSRWATFASTEVQAKLGITTAFGGGLGGTFTALSPTLSPTPGISSSAVSGNSGCQGASADALHVFFRVGGAAYLPGDPVPDFASGHEGKDNVYDAYRDQNGTPTAELLTRDKDGVLYGGRCGPVIGGLSTRGSVSPDASRVYFSTRPSQGEGTACEPAANKLRIMERLRTPAGPVISEPIASECTRLSPPCSMADGNDIYQGASQEGGRILFTTTRQLTSSDKDASADLYLYEATQPAGEQLTQLSAGDGSDPTPGEGAEVQGVPDFAGDASHLYFVAKGVLTTAANQQGQSAQAGQPNLYLYEYPAKTTTFLATLSAGDTSTWSVGPGGNAAMAVPTLGPDPEDQSVGGDGHILVFQSREPLLSEDQDGSRTDSYRYDSSSGSLQLVSKPAAGATGNEAIDVAGAAPLTPETGPQALSFKRWVSEDGETVAFETEEALDPSDTNGKRNAYLSHEGDVTAIPFGIEATVSMAGDELAFVSDQKLLPQDGDGAKDVYLLRAGGGFPIAPPAQPCLAEACQGAPGAQPGDLGALSEAVRAGNPPTATPCRKGFARKRGSCVRQPARHKAKKHRKHRKGPAGRKQGGRK